MKLLCKTEQAALTSNYLSFRNIYYG